MLRSLWNSSFKKVHKDAISVIYKTDIKTLYHRFNIKNDIYKFDKQKEIQKAIYCDDFVESVILAEEILPNELVIKRGYYDLTSAKELYKLGGKNMGIFIRIKEPEVVLSSKYDLDKHHYN